MNANAELQKQIVNYGKTRAVYVEYRKAGYSKKFRAAHEAEILLHQTAKKYFDEVGITKLPSVKSLREEYTDLLEQKRKAYSAYKQAKEAIIMFGRMWNIYWRFLPRRNRSTAQKNTSIRFVCFSFSAFQRNAQPLPQAMISGVWDMSPTSI